MELFSFLFAARGFFPGDLFLVFEEIFGFNLAWGGFFFFALSVCLDRSVTRLFFLFSGGFSA